MEIFSLVGKIALDGKVAVENALKEIDGKAKDVADRFNQVGSVFTTAGKKMSDTGKNLSKYITAPLAGIGVAAGKMSIDFESAFAGVKKTVDASEEDLAKLRQGIRDMAKEIPASAKEIAGVAEAAGQLGIEVPNILSFTRTMIDLGEATNLSADQAATSLARLANITQMPQTEFDRLGSTIVALGNNLATTEAEIVEMGLRLAGAGAQVGMTEAQILGFAGALSSVGIAAEAGGSAFSRVMVDMQLAVETGGERLEQFARVAGMSAEEFQRAFKEDAAGAIISFIQGLSTAEERGISAIKVLDDMGITEIRLRDALLRAAGAGDLFNEAIMIGTQAWEENIALTTEAEQRYGTTASQMEILRNKLVDAGIELGDKLTPILRDSVIPLVEKLIGHISGLLDWFSSLDPKWQQVILTAIGFTAALGPLLSVIGKIITVVGTITGALPVLGTAFTALTGPIGIAIAAIAALTAGGIALYKHMQKDSIPTVNLFGDTVSEATQQAVGSFMELNEQATLALNQLSWSGQEVTQEMADSITNNFSQMAEQVQAGLDSHYQESLQKMQAFVNNSASLSEEEQEQILANMQQGYENRKQTIEEGEARIKEILQTASEEKRALTKEEQEEINAIQQEMVNTGIQVLSENELEAKVIMERMRQQAGEISARQAAEVVQNSLRQKEETIKAAEEQYNEVIKEIIRQRDEAGTITAEQADELIQEAKRQRDEVVTKAEEMHNQVVEQAKLQAGEHVNQVDWETGEIKTKWQVMKDDIIQKAKEIKEDVVDKWEEIKKSTAEKWGNVKKSVSDSIEEVKSKISEGIEKIKEWNDTSVKEKVFSIVEKVKRVFSDIGNAVSSAIGRNAQGTNFWRGGLTWVGEQGPELVNLPKGSRIYSNKKSIDLIKSAPELAAGGIIQRSGLALVGEAGPELLELPQGAKVKPLTGESIDYDRLEAIAYASFYDAFVDALKTLGKGEIRINIDGRTLAREMIPRIIAENQRLGVVTT